MGERYDRIRELAKDKGITVAAIERDLGFAKGSISKIDKNIPSSDRLSRMASYLDTTSEYILNGSSKEEPTYYYSTKTDESADKILRENFILRLLFEAMRDSSERQLEEVYDYLLFLKEKEKK